MRNFAGDLGVRCQFCHVGQEGQPLQQFDFTSDDKRTKQVARQMMLMVQEINWRIDSIPGHTPRGDSSRFYERRSSRTAPRHWTALMQTNANSYYWANLA